MSLQALTSRLVAVALVGLVWAGCGADLDRTEGTDSSRGSGAIVIELALESAPPLLHTLHLLVHHPTHGHHRDQVTLTGIRQIMSVTGLESGSWTVVVSGNDAQGQVMLCGIAQAGVVPGFVTGVTVELKPAWRCDLDEVACGDGVDNDEDGLTDCDDPLCEGEPCNDGDSCTRDEFCTDGVCGDGEPYCGTDRDGDGVDDAIDNCIDVSNANQYDADGDDIGDAGDSSCDCVLPQTSTVICDGVCRVGTCVETWGDCNALPGCETKLTGNDAYAWYLDGEGDGYGDPNDTPVLACGPLTGRVNNNLDNCPEISNANQYDADGDGIGDVCDPVCDCALPHAEPICDGVCLIDSCIGDWGDCNTDPGCETDLTSDDAYAWYLDGDEDVYGDENDTPVLHCDPQAGRINNNLDCDDSKLDVNPDGVESSCDGIDDNCDSIVDLAYCCVDDAFEDNEPESSARLWEAILQNAWQPLLAVWNDEDIFTIPVCDTTRVDVTVTFEGLGNATLFDFIPGPNTRVILDDCDCNQDVVTLGWEANVNDRIYLAIETRTEEDCVPYTLDIDTGCVVCGDGDVEGAEECDEGAANGLNSCCTSSCTYKPLGDYCGFGLPEDWWPGPSERWCEPTRNACDGAGTCRPAAEPCDDGVSCTYDICNQSLYQCENTPIDAFCADGNSCTTNTCDAVLDCQMADADGAGCIGNGCSSTCLAGQCQGCTCASELDCDDGVFCTKDLCESGDCVHAPLNAACSDYPFCAGDEYCDPTLGCQAVNIDPCIAGDACNNTCSEGPDSCVSADTTTCDDGLYCTATDTCLAGDCTGTGDPCTPGVTECDEDRNMCVTP